MNKEQYKNVIDWTKKHTHSTDTIDSLAMTRSIFNNMGVPFPQGNHKEVIDILTSNDYMGWVSCTSEEAQNAANNGIATVGIDDSQFFVIEPIDLNTTTYDKTAELTFPAAELSMAGRSSQYYVYSYGNTTTMGSDISKEEISNGVLFTKLDQLHQLAKDYTNNDNRKSILRTLQFIRRGEYSDGNWNVVAGEIDQEFVDYVSRCRKDIFDYFTNKKIVVYDTNKVNPQPIDFNHLCATMNGIIIGGGTYWKSLVVGATHVRNLAGWAGDLQTLVVDAYQKINGTDNYHSFYSTFYSIIGDESYTFGLSDLYADIDAYIFANNWASSYWQSNLFGSACRYYYNNTAIPGTSWISKSSLRFTQFSASYPDKEKLKDTIEPYTKQYWSLVVEWPLYEKTAQERNITLNLTKNHSNAACDAFADYLWKRRQEEKI